MQRYARVPVLLLLTHRSLCLFLVKQQQKKQREQKHTQEEEEEDRQTTTPSVFFNKYIFGNFSHRGDRKKNLGRLSLEKNMRFFRRILRGKKSEFAIFRQRVSAVRQNYGSHTGDHPQEEFAKFGLGYSPKRKLGNFRNPPI
jgi:hypothetical protein